MIVRTLISAAILIALSAEAPPVNVTDGVPPAALAALQAGQKAVAEDHDFPTAVKLLTQAIEAAPKFGSAYAVRGGTYLQMKDAAAAAKDFEKALALGLPDQGRGYIVSLLGISYRSLGRSKDAVRVYSKWLESPHDPWGAETDWDVLMQRSEAYLLAKDFVASRADLDRALALSPDNPQLISRYAVLEASAKNFGKALGASDELLTLRPDDPDAIKMHEVMLQAAQQANQASVSFPASATTTLEQGLSKLRHGNSQADFAALRLQYIDRPSRSAARWPQLGTVAEAPPARRRSSSIEIGR